MYQSVPEKKDVIR